MRPKKLLKRILSTQSNVHFDDFKKLIMAFGFQHIRTSGSHHIFSHAELEELINIQEVSGEAKPYQIRQFLKIIERYNLKVG